MHPLTVGYVTSVLGKEQAERLEELSAAFLTRTDIHPAEVELVVFPYLEGGKIGNAYRYRRHIPQRSGNYDLERVLNLRGLSYEDWVAEKVREDFDFMARISSTTGVIP